MTIALTGATGFLGSHLLKAALKAGHSVVAIGRRPPNVSHGALQFVESPIGLELAAAPVPWDKLDAVVHLAAAGVKAPGRVWPEALSVNVVGTQVLLDTLEQRAPQRPPLMVATTFYEDFVAVNPALLENTYIATKRAATDLVRLWTARTEWPVCLTRIFQLYGPGDNPSNVLPYAVQQFSRGEVAHFGSGSGLRDWIYIDDAVRALMLLLEEWCPTASWGASEFDIGSGELTSIKDMVIMLTACAEVDPGTVCIFDPSRDRPDATPPLVACQFPLGFNCRVGLAQGLRYLWDAAKDDAQ